MLLEEGGAVQGLPITGVLEWTAVRRDKIHFEDAVLNALLHHIDVHVMRL